MASRASAPIPLPQSIEEAEVMTPSFSREAAVATLMPLTKGPQLAEERKPEAIVTGDSSPVDLAVLDARIRSFNLTLAKIESELSELREWNGAALQRLIDQLDRVFAHRAISETYYNALSGTERGRVSSFQTTRRLSLLLEQRLFEARVALLDANSSLSQEQRTTQADKLQSISRRIQSWTVE
jgi:hypothetical protein